MMWRSSTATTGPSCDGSVRERADTVIWLDVSKPVALWQVSRHTLGRALTGAELWNGNVGPTS